MSGSLTFEDFSTDGGARPSPQELETQLRAALESGGPLTLTLTKPLAEVQASPDGEYTLPFDFDIKIFTYKGEFRITTGPHWSAVADITVTVTGGTVSRRLTFELSYQHAEHCQGFSIGDFASGELCAGMRTENSKRQRLCAYLRGNIRAFALSGDFDEQIGCVPSLR